MKKIIFTLLGLTLILSGCIRKENGGADNTQTGIIDSPEEITMIDSAKGVTETEGLERKDSLFQDTINRDFSTPDLALFDVHGKVKSITYVTGSNENVPFPFFKLNYPFKFTEKGKIENLETMIRKVVFDENLPYFITTKANAKDELTKVLLEWRRNSGEDGEAFICGIKIKWKNGKVTSFQNYATHEMRDFVIYYENNRISQITEDKSDQGSVVDGKYKFEGYKFDEVGNWTECDITYNKKGDSYMGPIKEHGKIHVKRNIEYYL